MPPIEYERDGVTRREFIKAGGGVVALTGAYLLGELGVEAYRQYVTHERSKYLPTSFVQNIPNNNIVVGFSPDNNKTVEGLTLASALNTHPQLLNYFLHDFDYSEFYSQIRLCHDNRIIPVISFGVGGAFLSASRRSDLFYGLRKIVSELESSEQPYILRPYYEFNSPWAQDWWGHFTPQQFISLWHDMYQYIHERSEYAHMCLSYNSTIYIDPVSPNSFQRWFPGVEYVDIIALDVYNKNTDYIFKPEHYLYPDFPPKIVLGPDLFAMRQLAPSKGILLSEINCMKEGGKAEWLQEAITYSLSVGAIGWISFDWDKSGHGETKWNPINYPKLISTYQEELAKPYYISTNQVLRTRSDYALECLYRNPFT